MERRRGKKSITDFVAHLTARGGAGVVPPAERIATFDNDGTLWCAQPFHLQLAFAPDQIKVMAPQHPEWKMQQPFKAPRRTAGRRWRERKGAAFPEMGRRVLPEQEVTMKYAIVGALAVMSTTASANGPDAHGSEFRYDREQRK